MANIMLRTFDFEGQEYPPTSYEDLFDRAFEFLQAALDPRFLEIIADSRVLNEDFAVPVLKRKLQELSQKASGGRATSSLVPVAGQNPGPSSSTSTPPAKRSKTGPQPRLKVSVPPTFVQGSSSSGQAAASAAGSSFRSAVPRTVSLHAGSAMARSISGGGLSASSSARDDDHRSASSAGASRERKRKRKEGEQ